MIAETSEALRRDLAALTGPLGLPERKSSDDDVKLFAVLNWLRHNPVWLLIIDGVDTEYALKEVIWLMSRMAGGHVLITSQLTNFPPNIAPFELDSLETEAAAQFLVERTKHRRRTAPDDASKSRELADVLGELALALETAAAFIAEKRLTFSEYLEGWDVNRLEVLKSSNPAAPQYPLAVTFQISISRVSEDARRLLQRLAWFSPEPVPEFVLDVPIPTTGDNNLSDQLDELSCFSRDSPPREVGFLRPSHVAGGDPSQSCRKTASTKPRRGGALGRSSVRRRSGGRRYVAPARTTLAARVGYR